MGRLQVMLIMAALLFSSVGRADNWLITVLSGNARSDVWLIPLDESSDHTSVLHHIADSKTDPAFVGRFGNIAQGNFKTAEDNAIYLTNGLLTKILPEVVSLQNAGKLGKTPKFSFLYAMAGLDAVDGQVKGYKAPEGRKALYQYESAVDEQFSTHGIALDALLGVHDGSLLLSAVQTAGTASQNIVVYDDTYGIGYLIKDGVVVDKSSAEVDEIPAGGYYQLGYQGGNILEGEDKLAADKLNIRLRDFWQTRYVFYSPEEILMRYGHNNRNELGGVMSRLVQSYAKNGEMYLNEELGRTVDVLAKLSLNLREPSSDKSGVVKIIGYYGDALKGLPVLKERFREMTGDTLVPELIQGEQLGNALTASAAKLYQQLMQVRYGEATP